MPTSSSRTRLTASIAASIAALACLLLAPSTSDARSFRVTQVPNGSVFGCGLCHNSPGGGSRNVFGQQVEANLSSPGPGGDAVWEDIFDLDADGDGVTNGEELGDPEGLWRIGDPNPDGRPSAPFDETDTGEPAPECTEDADCTDADGGACEEGVCVYDGDGDCNDDSECPDGQECIANVCSDPANNNGGATNNATSTNNATGGTNNGTTSTNNGTSDGTTDGSGSGTTDDDEDDGCAVSPGTPHPATPAFLLMGLVIAFARRRRS